MQKDKTQNSIDFKKPFAVNLLPFALKKAWKSDFFIITLQVRIFKEPDNVNAAY